MQDFFHSQLSILADPIADVIQKDDKKDDKKCPPCATVNYYYPAKTNFFSFNKDTGLKAFKDEIDGSIGSDSWRLVDKNKVYFDSYKERTRVSSHHPSRPTGKWYDESSYNKFMENILESMKTGNILTITMGYNMGTTISYFMTDPNTYVMFISNTQETYERDIFNEAYRDIYKLPRAPTYQ